LAVQSLNNKRYGGQYKQDVAHVTALLRSKHSLVFAVTQLMLAVLALCWLRQRFTGWQHIFISLCVCCRIYTTDTTFEARLHLTYLINDVMHHWWERATVLLWQLLLLY